MVISKYLKAGVQRAPLEIIAAGAGAQRFKAGRCP
jgi:hypothetical protein